MAQRQPATGGVGMQFARRAGAGPARCELNATIVSAFPLDSPEPRADTHLQLIQLFQLCRERVVSVLRGSSPPIVDGDLAMLLDTAVDVRLVIDGVELRLDGVTVRSLQAWVRSTNPSPARGLSPEEAARQLGVSRPTVVRWIREGLLPDEPVGAHHRIPADAVDELARMRRDRAKAAQLRVAGLTSEAVTPTPEDVFAAARAARAGDAAELDRLRDADLRARADAAAAAAAGASG
jgi:excisionase family DNA binding protein